MALDRIILQFSTTPLTISNAIRLATKSKFSHVDLVVPRGAFAQFEPIFESLMPDETPYGLLGASDPGGVIIRPPQYHVFLRRHRMTLVTDKAEAFFSACAAEIGKPFDNTALLRVFDPNWKGADWRDNGAWYCVELMMAKLLKVNFWEHRKYPIDANLNNVTPEDMIKFLAGEFDPKEFEEEIGAAP